MIRGTIVGLLAVALLGLLPIPPPDEDADAMDARLASAAVERVGPRYLYPDPATTPGAVNPDITQATIGETICKPSWSTKSIRPPASYTTSLKRHQLAASGAADQTLSHYEEDHLSAATRTTRGTCGRSSGARQIIR